MTLTTGMLMSGKMSVGIRTIASTPRMTIQHRHHDEGVGAAEGERTIHMNLHRDRRHNKAFAHFRDNNLLHTKSPIPSFYTIGRGKIGLRFLLGFCKECLLGC
jgi:hypothetical protein